MRALVVHGGNHRDDDLAVGERKHRNLGSGEEFLDNDVIARRTEDLVRHHRANSVLCLSESFGDDNALAERKTVRFDNDGHILVLKISDCTIHIVENFVSRCGDRVFLHKILRERLASLNDSRLFVGAEAGNTDRGKCVNATENERIVGGDDSVVDGIFGGELNDAVNILRADRDAGRVSRDTAVAGQTVDIFDVLVLLDRLNNGVFTAAAADDENIHRNLVLLLNFVGRKNKLLVTSCWLLVEGEFSPLAKIFILIIILFERSEKSYLQLATSA